MVKIFVDPGHGRSDPGAVRYGLSEKDVTLKIATRIRDILQDEYKNATVKMSRTGDQTVSLEERTDMANAWGADFYLAVHINSGTEPATRIISTIFFLIIRGQRKFSGLFIMKSLN
ncbi:N-acetylmuramoyl-L-alanine amidase [Neobacillus niacini]|nr:N-acetylmuramoyl-L-alanine amidase [Neobacillus niacini]